MFVCLNSRLGAACPVLGGEILRQVTNQGYMLCHVVFALPQHGVCGPKYTGIPGINGVC